MVQPTTQSCESAVSVISSALHLLLAERSSSDLHKVLPVWLHYPVAPADCLERHQNVFDRSKTITESFRSAGACLGEPSVVLVGVLSHNVHGDSERATPSCSKTCHWLTRVCSAVVQQVVWLKVFVIDRNLNASVCVISQQKHSCTSA